MPKIIENLRQRLMEEARSQAEELGYSAMTIRSVAKGCDVGVGTVYNYYPSKDELIAAFIQYDWVESMEPLKGTYASLEEVLRVAYDGLNRFLKRNERIFRDEAAKLVFSGNGGRYHSMVRSALSAAVRPHCRDEFTAQFLAEALVTWVVEGVDFDTLCPVLLRLQ